MIPHYSDSPYILIVYKHLITSRKSLEPALFMLFIIHIWKITENKDSCNGPLQYCILNHQKRIINYKLYHKRQKIHDRKV